MLLKPFLPTSAFLLASLTALIAITDLKSSRAAERPTLNHTRDPRPDILPHPIADNHVEYRKAMNRPRNVPGFITHAIAPTSQEAMVWRENHYKGVYQDKDAGPICKRYYGPKAWEVLPIGPRPGFPKDSLDDFSPNESSNEDESAKSNAMKD